MLETLVFHKVRRKTMEYHFIKNYTLIHIDSQMWRQPRIVWCRLLLNWLARGPGVVPVWSRCGPGVVPVWSRCGPGVVPVPVSRPAPPPPTGCLQQPPQPVCSLWVTVGLSPPSGYTGYRRPQMHPLQRGASCVRSFYFLYTHFLRSTFSVT